MNGSDLAIGVYIVIVLVWTFWPEIRARFILDGNATHPDALSSMDLRERGLDPVDGVLEHEARMNARAERLGYTR